MVADPELPPVRAHGALVDAALLLVLVAFTVLSVTVAGAHGSIALILALAFAKAVAIGYRYMMLSRAPRLLLALFASWAIVFFTLTTVLAIR